MRRRRAALPDSLELLLDTITNAFGGILFMAILVTLLLQLNRNRLQSESTLETPPQPERLAQLRTQIQLQRKTLESQQRLLERLSPEAARALLDKAEQLRSQREALQTRITDAQRGIKAAQVAVAEAEAMPANLTAALHEARERLANEQAALRAEVASRQQTARLPRLRSTRKMEAVAALRYDRFYVLCQGFDSPRGERLNRDDFVITEQDGDTLTITPKPYAGLPVANASEFESRLRAKLWGLDPDEVYLAVIVWEDSFDSFVPLKNALVSLGFEYRLIPLRKGEAVGSGYVPDPQVQ